MKSPRNIPASVRQRLLTYLIQRNHGFGGQISIAYRRGPFLRQTKSHKLDCTQRMDLSRWTSIKKITLATGNHPRNSTDGLM